MMRALIPLLLLFASMISGKYLLVETDSSEKVNYCQISLMLNKSYDDSVKLKRTEMDPFRLG